MLLISLYIGSLVKTGLLVLLIVYLYKTLISLKTKGKSTQDNDDAGRVTVSGENKKSKKIFSKDSGVYVEYEDVDEK